MGRSHAMELVKREPKTKAGAFAAEPQGLAGWVLELLRRWRGLREVKGRQLHLVETLPLGGKRELMLVSCAGERFLVGGGSEGVETIVRLESEVSSGGVAKEMEDTWL